MNKESKETTFELRQAPLVDSDLEEMVRTGEEAAISPRKEMGKAGERWESPLMERAVAMLPEIGGEEEIYLPRMRREWIRALGGLGGLISGVILTYKGLEFLGGLAEWKARENRKEESVNSWQVILRSLDNDFSKEQISNFKSELDRHLIEGVDPDKKEGWTGMFGEQAEALAKAIEKEIKEGTYKSYEDFERQLEEQGISQEDMMIMKQLWQVYTTGEGQLRNALEAAKEKALQERILHQSGWEDYLGGDGIGEMAQITLSVPEMNVEQFQRSVGQMAVLPPGFPQRSEMPIDSVILVLPILVAMLHPKTSLIGRWAREQAKRFFP